MQTNKRAKIIATGICHNKAMTGSIELATVAAGRCIESAGIDPQEIRYLINVGVYRDENMVEPSMAVLIQKRLGINLDFTRYPDQTPTFSTDLMNGAIGSINAFQVADGFIKSGRSGYSLVVASDCHPSGQIRELHNNEPTHGNVTNSVNLSEPLDLSWNNFPIEACGSAVLLGPSETAGFEAFHFATADRDEIDKLELGQAGYVDFEQHGQEGKIRITIETSPEFYDKLLRSTIQEAAHFIEAHSLDSHNMALVAPSFNESFAHAVGRALGFYPEHVIDLWPNYRNPFTSTYMMGLHELRQRCQSSHGLAVDSVLIVGCSSGYNLGCSVYRI